MQYIQRDYLVVCVWAGNEEEERIGWGDRG